MNAETMLELRKVKKGTGTVDGCRAPVAVMPTNYWGECSRCKRWINPGEPFSMPERPDQAVCATCAPITKSTIGKAKKK